MIRAAASTRVLVKVLGPSTRVENDSLAAALVMMCSVYVSVMGKT